MAEQKRKRPPSAVAVRDVEIRMAYAGGVKPDLNLSRSRRPEFDGLYRDLSRSGEKGCSSRPG
jgi:hypothetical protein